jgi:hypothetical protein
VTTVLRVWWDGDKVYSGQLTSGIGMGCFDWAALTEARKLLVSLATSHKILPRT